MILSLLFYILVAYLLYRLVFGFIIPVVRTTRRVKKSFRQMQEQMNAHQQQGNPYEGAYGQKQKNAAAGSTAKATKGDDEDYIEFEEVK